MKTIILFFIKTYQNLTPLRKSLSNHLPFSLGATNETCRFTPTCSTFSFQAIEKHGVLKGFVLSIKRIARCHPWSRGGFDPIPS